MKIQLDLAEEEKNAGDDRTVQAALLAAAARGFTFYEEKVTAQLSRFSVILTDGRLVSSVRFEERRLALFRVCLALASYLDQFEPKNRLTSGR